jgi:hypothetical protein
MSHRHQLGECLGSANCADVAYRPCTGTMRTSSLRGGQIGGRHVEKWLAFWFGSNSQRPHLAKQSNKPKLQSRFPSGPIGRFLAFLLPPTCIGAVTCKNTQKHTKRDMRRTLELPQSIGKLGEGTDGFGKFRGSRGHSTAPLRMRRRST